MVRLRTENLNSGRRAGLALVQSDKTQLRLEITDGRAEAILCENGRDSLAGSCDVPEGEATLFLRVKGLSAEAGQKTEAGEEIFAGNLDIRSLSTEVSGGFVGCCAGLYAVAEGEDSEERALFKSLEYRV